MLITFAAAKVQIIFYIRKYFCGIFICTYHFFVVILQRKIVDNETIGNKKGYRMPC